jgi:hypothetical protein
MPQKDLVLASVLTICKALFVSTMQYNSVRFLTLCSESGWLNSYGDLCCQVMKPALKRMFAALGLPSGLAPVDRALKARYDMLTSEPEFKVDTWAISTGDPRGPSYGPTCASIHLYFARPKLISSYDSCSSEPWAKQAVMHTRLDEITP